MEIEAASAPLIVPSVAASRARQGGGEGESMRRGRTGKSLEKTFTLFFFRRRRKGALPFSLSFTHTGSDFIFL